MTARQIRIACCGMVVSTLPVPEPLTNEALYKLADNIIYIFDALRPYGEPRMWLDEGQLARIVRRWA